jgi:hypothetical protein
LETFTEEDKGQHIREFLRKAGDITSGLPDASRIYLLRMKTAHAISTSIATAVVSGKNYD